MVEERWEPESLHPKVEGGTCPRGCQVQSGRLWEFRGGRSLQRWSRGRERPGSGERKVGLDAQTLGQVHADTAPKAVYALRPVYSLGLEFKDTFL